MQGILEIHASELLRQHIPGANVRDLVAIVNEKLRALTPDWPKEVKNVIFFGNPVTDDLPLEAFMLELATSCPRLAVPSQKTGPGGNDGMLIIVALPAIEFCL